MWVRRALALAGLLALPLLFYVTVFAAVAGLDGHDSFVDAVEFAARATLLLVPVLLLACIVLSWVCRTTRRLRLLGIVFGALFLDVGACVYLLHLS